MTTNFWHNLPHPFFCLAPMEDVTDAAFRFIIARHGKPDVMFTEFTSADGLVSEGRPRVARDLAYDESERPIVAQLFTSQPEHMKQAAQIAQDMGFDGVDINMGCPDKAIEKQGCGASLIKNHALATELIDAAKEGAPRLPISIKTRIGYNKNELEPWLTTLLKTKPAAVTLHLRTRKEMSDVPAHWDAASDAVSLRDKLNSDSLIIGNGDIASRAEAQQKAGETGVDGVMIGRGIYGNPWFFNQKKQHVSSAERLSALIEHARLFEKLAPHKNFSVMKKHFKAYVNGWAGAKELRMELMECENADEVTKIIQRHLPGN